MKLCEVAFLKSYVIPETKAVNQVKRERPEYN
jgi:hypothetical protein